MKGLPSLLRSYLRQDGGWIAKNELTARVWKYEDGSGRTYGADLVSRKLRNLEEASIIAVKHVNGASVYKYLPTYLTALYIPISQRTGESIWKDEGEMRRLLGAYQTVGV